MCEFILKSATITFYSQPNYNGVISNFSSLTSEISPNCFMKI
jgi:hypothetical protein